jgi:hypothetical protein
MAWNCPTTPLESYLSEFICVAHLNFA